MAMASRWVFSESHQVSPSPGHLVLPVQRKKCCCASRTTAVHLNPIASEKLTRTTRQEQHEMQSYGQQPQYGQPQYQYDQQSPYGSNQPQQDQYGSPYQQEQYGSPQPQQGGGGGGGGNVLTQTEFLSRVKAIRNDIQSLTTDIRNIATLHQQALASSDGAAQHQLDDLVHATQIKNTSIRSQIQALKADTERTTDNSFGVKKRQFETLNGDFKDTIQRFLQEEQQYKERYREQIARQYRIVNPDATDEQVQQAASADWGDEGVFQTAVCFAVPQPQSQPNFSFAFFFFLLYRMFLT